MRPLPLGTVWSGCRGEQLGLRRWFAGVLSSSGCSFCQWPEMSRNEMGTRSRGLCAPSFYLNKPSQGWCCLVDSKKIPLCRVKHHLNTSRCSGSTMMQSWLGLLAGTHLPQPHADFRSTSPMFMEQCPSLARSTGLAGTPRHCQVMVGCLLSHWLPMGQCGSTHRGRCCALLYISG